jgi:2-succinyl-5-enolpyruvyl-6-hydroxy-3-cyclohexene-1-carboxylate synthase
LRDKFPSATPDLKSYDSVLRIGGVPTHRLWRDLETSAHEVLSISECPFSGLYRSALIHAPLASFFSNFTPMPKASPSNLPVMDYDQEELLIHDLSKKLPLNSLVYLGNSMPIRHWDKAATFEDRGYKILASRGTNGIDGQLSTFFGLAEPGRSNWCILGDLTALYDLTAPWFLSQLSHNINIVIINNRGGRIFEKMFPGPEMLNSHNLSFEPVAKLWNLSYEKWREVPSDISGPSPRLIELAL